MSLSVLDPAAVAPVLEEALGLAEEALMAQKESQTKLAAKEQENANLRAQMVNLEKVTLEKVAKQQTLNPVDLERLFDRFEDLHIMTPKERVKMAAHVQRDPGLLVPMFLKAADMLSGAPAEGAGIPREDGSTIEGNGKDDGWVNDGWDAAVQGKVVQLKR